MHPALRLAQNKKNRKKEQEKRREKELSQHRAWSRGTDQGGTDEGSTEQDLVGAELVPPELRHPRVLLHMMESRLVVAAASHACCQQPILGWACVGAGGVSRYAMSVPGSA
eukprot:409152-Rhodomonas_salina.2